MQLPRLEQLRLFVGYWHSSGSLKKVYWRSELGLYRAELEPAVAGTENCGEIPLGHRQHFALRALLRNHEVYGLATYKTS